MIEDLNPDLILVDLSMPVMSGLDFLDEMRQDWPDMKCLILSGHAEEGYIKAAEEHGANGYILKAKPRAIMEAIERSLTENHFICPDNLTW